MYSISICDRSIASSESSSSIGNSDFDFKNVVPEIAQANTSKSLNSAYTKLADSTHITENIMLKGRKGFLSKNLKGFIEDFVKVDSALTKEGIKDVGTIERYLAKATKLVNWKSFAGLGIIIPLAISMQPINRWITAKHSGKTGAPIYKDFIENNDSKILTRDEKKSLLKQKFI